MATTPTTTSTNNFNVILGILLVTAILVILLMATANRRQTGRTLVTLANRGWPQLRVTPNGVLPMTLNQLGMLGNPQLREMSVHIPNMVVDYARMHGQLNTDGLSQGFQYWESFIKEKPEFHLYRWNDMSAVLMAEQLDFFIRPMQGEYDNSIRDYARDNIEFYVKESIAAGATFKYDASKELPDKAMVTATAYAIHEDLARRYPRRFTAIGGHDEEACAVLQEPWEVRANIDYPKAGYYDDGAVIGTDGNAESLGKNIDILRMFYALRVHNSKGGRIRFNRGNEELARMAVRQLMYGYFVIPMGVTGGEELSTVKAGARRRALEGMQLTMGHFGVDDQTDLLFKTRGDAYPRVKLAVPTGRQRYANANARITRDSAAGMYAWFGDREGDYHTYAIVNSHRTKREPATMLPKMNLRDMVLLGDEDVLGWATTVPVGQELPLAGAYLDASFGKDNVPGEGAADDTAKMLEDTTADRGMASLSHVGRATPNLDVVVTYWCNAGALMEKGGVINVHVIDKKARGMAWGRHTSGLPETKSSVLATVCGPNACAMLIDDHHATLFSSETQPRFVACNARLGARNKIADPRGYRVASVGTRETEASKEMTAFVSNRLNPEVPHDMTMDRTDDEADGRACRFTYTRGPWIGQPSDPDPNPDPNPEPKPTESCLTGGIVPKGRIGTLSNEFPKPAPAKPRAPTVIVHVFDARSKCPFELTNAHKWSVYAVVEVQGQKGGTFLELTNGSRRNDDGLTVNGVPVNVTRDNKRWAVIPKW